MFETSYDSDDLWKELKASLHVDMSEIVEGALLLVIQWARGQCFLPFLKERIELSNVNVVRLVAVRSRLLEVVYVKPGTDQSGDVTRVCLEHQVLCREIFGTKAEEAQRQMFP